MTARPAKSSNEITRTPREPCIAICSEPRCNLTAPPFSTAIEIAFAMAVRDVVHGRPVKKKETLANPEALELFKDRVELGV